MPVPTNTPSTSLAPRAAPFEFAVSACVHVIVNYGGTFEHFGQARAEREVLELHVGGFDDVAGVGVERAGRANAYGAQAEFDACLLTAVARFERWFEIHLRRRATLWS